MVLAQIGGGLSRGRHCRRRRARTRPDMRRPNVAAHTPSSSDRGGSGSAAAVMTANTARMRTIANFPGDSHGSRQ